MITVVTSDDLYSCYDTSVNNPKKIKCKHCVGPSKEIEITKSTTVAKNHLIRKHPDLAISKRISKENNEKAKNEASKKSANASTGVQSILIVNSKYSKDNPKQIKFNTNLINYAVRPTVSINSLSENEFTKLIRDLDPRITVPSRPTLTSNIFQASIEARNKLKRIIDETKNNLKFNLTLDLWRSYTKEFLAIIIFFNKKHYLLNIEVINASKITTEVIQRHLNEVLVQYDISLKDNICGICVDGASNLLRIHENIDEESIDKEGISEEIIEVENAEIENSGSDLDLNLSNSMLNMSLEIASEVDSNEYLELNQMTLFDQTPIINNIQIFEESPLQLPFRIHCFAHQLNLLFSDVFKKDELKAIHKLISILVKIKGKRNLHNEIYLRTKKRVLLPSETRWFYIVMTIERALELKDNTNIILSNNDDLPNFLNSEWNAVNGCLEVFNSIKFAIQNAHSDSFFLADVIPCLKRLEYEINLMKQSNQSTKEKIRFILETCFKSRFSKYLSFEKNPMYFIATFLEPKYRLFIGVEEAQQISNCLGVKFGETQERDNSTAINFENDELDPFHSMFAKKRKLDLEQRKESWIWNKENLLQSHL